jgi:hypothetical protein
VVKKNDSVGHICYLKLEVALTYKKINAEFWILSLDNKESSHLSHSAQQNYVNEYKLWLRLTWEDVPLFS